MTSRQVYEGVLVEMNKVNAPSLLLEDFNYLFNKAINQYVNKRYNYYDVNQQTTDDLRVLKATAILPVRKTTLYGPQDGSVIAENSLYGAVYEVNLPPDYLHILNCICNFKVNKQIKCYDKDTYVQFGAFRLTSDIWSKIINNFYMRPSYKKPYFFIHNVNSINDEGVPTNPYNPKNMQTTGFGTGTDIQIKQSLSQQFEEFTKDFKLEGTKSFTTTNYVKDTQTLEAIQTEYQAFTDDQGDSYAVTLDTKTKQFGLIKSANVQLDINLNTLAINTLTNAVRVEDKNLVIDHTKLDANTLLVDEDLLKQYGEAYLDEGLPRFLHTEKYGDIDLVEKNGIHRYGNASNVRMEIRYGKDDSVFKLESVYVDYIKTPQHIRLTQEQLDLTEDTSQVMEFPDYVCQEIINELTHLFMENASDQRVSTHPTVVQSIAAPAQAQTQTT